MNSLKEFLTSLVSSDGTHLQKDLAEFHIFFISTLGGCEIDSPQTRPRPASRNWRGRTSGLDGSDEPPRSKEFNTLQEERERMKQRGALRSAKTAKDLADLLTGDGPWGMD